MMTRPEGPTLREFIVRKETDIRSLYMVNATRQRA